VRARHLKPDPLIEQSKKLIEAGKNLNLF